MTNCNNSINNNRGSAVILFTFLMLAGIMVAALGASDIVRNGLKASRVQNYSTKAFYAAETGLDRINWAIRKNDLFSTITCADDTHFCFTDTDPALSSFADCSNTCPTTNFQVLGNNASYTLHYKIDGQDRLYTATGEYEDTRRMLRMTICEPSCAGRNCGASDGCDDTCPSTCETVPGCQPVLPGDATEINPGSCCFGDGCYECNAGAAWDGNVCVAGGAGTCGDGIVQAPNGLGDIEICDTDQPLGLDQECRYNCSAIGYSYNMAGVTSINDANAFFTVNTNDQAFIDVTCLGGKVIEIWGSCENGFVRCSVGAVETASCRIECSAAYTAPDNDSTFHFVCKNP